MERLQVKQHTSLSAFRFADGPSHRLPEAAVVDGAIGLLIWPHILRSCFVTQ